MEDGIGTDHIKFWVDENIIYCKVSCGFDINYSKLEIEKLFIEAISILSDGSYKPILFNFEELNNLHSKKLFRFINNSTEIKNIVLSKAFIVSNYYLKHLFSFYVMFSNSILPITIFNGKEMAVEFCNKNNLFFNAVRHDN
ncbi:hypothetical protein [Xanthomarina sp.]|uniref:DUF7793 family protein n=1 Tax=Xanthomarina sp. TaxID=1931211 RepID=UPI002C3889DC|nr:hypothetical protein [Xanthomarina sp.]HLV39346.1 hypothetical protein [Xanthomarina sp.]